MTGAPDYRLHRVDDDCDAVMEIVPVVGLRPDTALPRREMFRAGVTAAVALGLLTACSEPAEPTTPAPSNTTPPPTTTPPTTTLPPTTTSRPPAAVVPPPTTTRRTPPRTTTPRRTPPRTRTRTRTRERGGGGTITKPCDKKPFPKGYVCTCNCVRVN